MNIIIIILLVTILLPVRCFISTESGRLEFEEFVTLAAKFIVEEDDEAMQKELKEAFRLYDKEGNFPFLFFWLNSRFVHCDSDKNNSTTLSKL